MIGKDIAYGPCHSIEVMQQPRTTRLEDIGTNSRCSQYGYTRVDLPYKSGMNRI